MIIYLFSAFLCGFTASVVASSLEPIVVNAKVGVLYQDETSVDREVIYQYYNVSKTLSGNSTKALRVYSQSVDASRDEPVTIVARQKKGVLSWQLPLTFHQTSAFVDSYSAVNRTLCPTSNFLFEVEDGDGDTLVVTVSSASHQKISFRIMVFEQEEFVLHFDKKYEVMVSPSAPIFFQLEIPKNIEVGLLHLRSDDEACMMLSVQNVTCPVHDLTTDVEFEGFYQSVHRQAGITFSRDEFPEGLFIVLIVRPDDDLCFGSRSYTPNTLPFRHKRVTFSVTEKISQAEYLAATFGAVFIFFSIYVGISLIWCIKCLRRRRRPAEQVTLVTGEDQPLLRSSPVAPERSSSSPLLISAEVHDCGDGLGSASNHVIYGSINCDRQASHNCDIEQDAVAISEEQDVVLALARSEDSSLDELDIDFLEDADHDKEIIRTKSNLFVSDLSRKSSRILAKKANLYQWNLLTIATFYALPVIQLVLTYQNVSNSTGNLDLCYYNFLCAQKLGVVSDFNHIFSNLGYVLLGFLFVVIVYARENYHQKKLETDPGLEHLGLPLHFGMYYAMGLGLIIEGIMSGCYHVCPNHTNFQFDTAFMYTIAILILLKIYQSRHPDINANAYTAFGVLAFVILVSTIGVLKGNFIFWIFFTSLHILSCLALSLNIYYMGRLKLNSGIFKRMWLICYNDVKAFCGGHWYALKPLYVDRMILLMVVNAANWGLSAYGIFVLGRSDDFASFLLAVFISNVMLYTMFYIVMKLRHRESIRLVPGLFLLFATITWSGSLYFFINKSTTWNKTPAISRDFNQDCKLFHFYDNHDIWHFLSATSLFFSFMILLTLDDDLEHVPRNQIHVF